MIVWVAGCFVAGVGLLGLGYWLGTMTIAIAVREHERAGYERGRRAGYEEGHRAGLVLGQADRRIAG